MPELLRTKLFIPRPRPGRVARPRLTERLNAGLNRKLTLVAAPAGFGKTTLLSEWIPQSPRCVAWLALDGEDNDPARFWTYVIAALQEVHPKLGVSALAMLQSPEAPTTAALITSLINEIAAFPESFAVSLEDYHVIDSQPIHSGMAYLIEHLPDNLHLTITTRVDPPLPLARLRAHNQLTELRSNELRFTPEEAGVFLARAMGLILSPHQVEALESRTEGWIAGLQIAALSMQGRDDISGFIEAFSGSHRHIVGYLAEEVLNQRPKGTLNFLLRTSVLDRLSGPLCDALTGESDGQATLEKLEQTNLFIAPLDDEGIWYRYHHLFAEVLQARLQRTQPEKVTELHRLAARWHARQGMTSEAVHHALAGADFDLAAALIEEAAGSMLRMGAIASLMRWLDALPEAMIRTRPRLSLARAWTYHLGPALSLERADGWAQLALENALAAGSLDSSLSGEIAALQSMIAATRSESTLSRDLAHQALENLPIDSPWRSAVTFCLGTAHVNAGDIMAAARAFEDAITLSQNDGAHYIQLAAAAFLGDILVLQGRLARAQAVYGQVLAWANPDLPQKGGVMAHAGLASILCEQNQLDAASAHVQAGAAMVQNVGGAWSAHVLDRALARVQLARGNRTEALAILERSYHNGRRAQVNLVVRQAAALQATVHLAQGSLDVAAAWAATSGLRPDDAAAAHPGWWEVEYLALARVLAAQGRQKEAFGLLDRLLDAARNEARAGSEIAILVLRATLHSESRLTNDRQRPLRQLEHALTLAEPEGFVRVFLDEGDTMRALLVEFQSTLALRPYVGENRRIAAYAGRLLAAFAQSAVADTRQPSNLIEPLSERELEILLLVAEGLSNREIADRLVIAVSTVKSHINAIYGKLGTHRRTQAVVTARELGLLPA